MPIQTIEKDLDGVNIKITQFSGVRGMKLKIRLFKVILPVLAPILGASGDVSKDTLANTDLKSVLPKAFMALAETLDENTFFRLLMDLMSQTVVDNRPIDEAKFNDLFAANYLLAYKIAYEVVIANNFLLIEDIGSLFRDEKASETEKTN